MKKFQKKNKILFSFIIAFIMLVSTGIVLLTNNNQNKIVKAAYNNFAATWQLYYFSGNFQISTGKYVWSDGTNYYYSSGAVEYIYNASTNSWDTMTWNGFSALLGNYVWSDGTNYYYSASTNQYILDISTSTWSAKTWNGLTSFDGVNIWSDGTDYYYTTQSVSYKLDTSTSTWSTVTFNINVRGEHVWSDGSDTFYSYNNVSYKLDISTSTWSTITFTGDLFIYRGSRIWHLDYNNNSYVIYTYNGNSYIVDTSNYILTQFTTNFDNNISGSNVTGEDIFYLNGYYYAGNIQNNVSGTLKLVLSNSGSGGDIATDNFVGNNIIVPFSIYMDSFVGSGLSENIGIHFASFQVSFEIDENDDYSMTFTTSYMPNSTTEIPFSYYTVGNSNTHLTDIIFTTSDIGNAFNVRAYDSTQYNDGTYPYYRYMSMNVAISSGFTNFAFVGVHMYSSYTTDVISSTTWYSINNFIEYFDANNEYIRISISNYTTIGTSIDLFSDRLYYFSNAVSGSGSNYSSYLSGYNDGYDEGYADGESDGYSTGSTSGYNNGYQAGYTAASGEVGQTQYQSGYQAGYTDGANDANTYSFTALIGSVIDTPIRYFSSLFNFNLLGVNLLTFMLALLTLGFVIIIIKHII